ncbi:hypothetical protein EWM64_g4530 [Hericium alpestre]|uniref:Uncharacterized protein n=1 Tax=Hericium alpestre TaxID=135208 RepID=A0A4Z0A189_9AGAM|nr:hypothetical protein EWM64_g4530 [Hericium alpestre]
MRAVNRRVALAFSLLLPLIFDRLLLHHVQQREYQHLDHARSVEILQVLVLPKAPITKPVLFSLMHQNTTIAAGNQADGDVPSKGLGVGAEKDISMPVASDTAAAAAIASVGVTAERESSVPIASGSVAAVQAAPPSVTEEDTLSPIIRPLRALPKPVVHTYAEIFSWDDPSDDFYIGTQPQEYPPYGGIQHLFKAKGKHKADPPVYIKSEEEDAK